MKQLQTDSQVKKEADDKKFDNVWEQQDDVIDKTFQNELKSADEQIIKQKVEQQSMNLKIVEELKYAAKHMSAQKIDGYIKEQVKDGMLNEQTDLQIKAQENYDEKINRISSEMELVQNGINDAINNVILPQTCQVKQNIQRFPSYLTGNVETQAENNVRKKKILISTNVVEREILLGNLKQMNKKSIIYQPLSETLDIIAKQNLLNCKINRMNDMMLQDSPTETENEKQHPSYRDMLRRQEDIIFELKMQIGRNQVKLG